MCRLNILLLVSSIGLAAACASVQERGDEAFEEGQYQEALEHYERAIDEGTRDWEVYARAARAAANEGSFSTAETYFARAYRYGGGTDVVRDFAAFYVRTSNYARAVRLYQSLLNADVEKQSVYNNLGTALMYADSALDAESYLLIAQQMEPGDPVPYANLGVLYERHLNKPRRAVGFYECYLELAGSKGRSQKIEQRIRELEQAHGTAGADDVACGEPYRPTGGSPSGRRAGRIEGAGSVDLDVGESSGRSTESPGSTAVEGDTDADGSDASRESGAETDGSRRSDGGAEQDQRESGSDSSSEIDVRKGRRPSGGSEDRRDPKELLSSGGEETDDSPVGTDREEILERAQREWKLENYSGVVREVSKLRLSSLSVDAMRIYGLSLAELERDAEAVQWLEWTVERQPGPESVVELLEVYHRRGREEDRASLCDEFAGREGYGRVEEACNRPLSVEEKQKALEEYRKKLKERKERGE